MFRSVSFNMSHNPRDQTNCSKDIATEYLSKLLGGKMHSEPFSVLGVESLGNWIAMFSYRGCKRLAIGLRD